MKAVERDLLILGAGIVLVVSGVFELFGITTSATIWVSLLIGVGLSIWSVMKIRNRAKADE